MSATLNRITWNHFGPLVVSILWIECPQLVRYRVFKCDLLAGAQVTINEEAEYLLKLWQLNVCPNCGQIITDGRRLGTGRRKDGGFCSLECYTNYYRLELQQQLALLRQRI